MKFSGPVVRWTTILVACIAGTEFSTCPKGALAQSVTNSPPGSFNASADEPTTWLVIRHAERDGEADRLTAAGNQRAVAVKELGELLNVEVIYSTDTQRTRGTVEALAQSRDIKIQLYSETSAAWFQKIGSLHKGKVVLIVGHSNTTGAIAGTLAGVQPFQIAHDDYNSLFVITTPSTSADSGTTEVEPADNGSLTASPGSVVRLKFGASSLGASAARADQMGPAK